MWHKYKTDMSHSSYSTHVPKRNKASDGNNGDAQLFISFLKWKIKEQLKNEIFINTYKSA